MSPARIALITSDHRRHRWLAGQIARSARLIGVVSESKPLQSPSSTTNPDADVQAYFRERDAGEEHWFREAPDFEAWDVPVKQVAWGDSNGEEAGRFVAAFEPDLLVLFGSCIIKDPLLARFAGRILNMHLGLSPYYRGSATNFWPLVDGKPECVGVTLHHATLQVDAGNILVQVRPEIEAGDSSHDLSCKAIIAGARCLSGLIADDRGLPPGRAVRGPGRLCRRADFTSGALRRMQHNFAEGIIPRYLAEKSERDARYPIVAFESATGFSHTHVYPG
jgi:hypothetical protein